jgi:hypothetical protein
LSISLLELEALDEIIPLIVATPSATVFTCASVAIAVPLLVAAVVLLGTTGLVENVLVQAIV